MTYCEKPHPHLKPVEKGRLFAPDYDIDLAEFDVNTADWQHICPCRFGDGRLCHSGSDTKWTGNSYRYDIFRQEKKTNYGDALVAMRWWNGGGEGWLVTKDKSPISQSCLLLTIAAIPEEERRWDACHFLWETAAKTALAAARYEYSRFSKAFVEKRLKKRKVRGRSAYRVEIEPALS